MDIIKFHFNGGMSDNHELNFYEASRFQYAAARFIYTLEKFRQDKRVVGRLTTKINADIRIKAATEGSFVQDVLIMALPAIADCAVQIPIEAMFAHAWSILFPASSEDTDLAIAIAKHRVDEEKERTIQEIERTSQIGLLTEVANANNATTNQTLEILRESMDQNRTLIIDNKEINQKMLKLATDRVKSEIDRNEILSEFIDPLSAIDSETNDRLAGQLRKAVPDMSLPLRSSADQLSIYTGGRETKSYAAFDYATGQAIGAQLTDEQRTTFRGTVKSYDREQGTGKFRLHTSSHPLSFRIPTEARSVVGPKTADALKMDSLLISVQIIRDSFNNPTSMWLWDVFPEDGED